jgi:tetratricopeptide (TPR) repeat protein
MECFEEALKIDKDFKKAWFNKGNCLKEKGCLKESLDVFDHLLGIDKNYK